MAVFHITGFVYDAIFQPHNQIILDTNSGVIGKLDTQLIDYFVQVGQVNDKRVSRLAILGNPAIGEMRMYFDTTKLESSAVITERTPDQYAAIFGIAELAYLSQNQTATMLDTLIRNETQLIAWYVPESLSISTVVNSATIYSPVEQSIHIPNWIEFSIYTNETHTEIIIVKLWLNATDFKVSYPHTTITRVICPRSPEIILSPSVTMSDLEAIISGSAYSFNQINTDLYANDQSGLFTFTTRYVLSSEKEYRLPFGIMYKGATPPSTVACRAAVKAYLLATGSITEDTLKPLFPELFVDLQYFLIPLWDYTTTSGERTIYPSISPNFNYTLEELKRLYPTLVDGYVEANMTYLLNAYNDMWIAAIPDPNNTDGTKLVDLHPTYNDHSSSMVEFAYMDTDTKQFSLKLSHCIAALLQVLATTEFNTFTLDNRNYLSFVIGRAEYQVMTPVSYRTILE